MLNSQNNTAVMKNMVKKLTEDLEKKYFVGLKSKGYFS